MPHICMDEILMFLAIFPFIGFYFKKLHAWYHAKHDHKCHEESCYTAHVEHHNESTCGDEYCKTSSNVKYLTEEDINRRRAEVLKYDFGPPDEEDHNGSK